MASKQKTVYICNNCSYESAKWYGKCPSCNEWGTLDEQIIKSSEVKNSKNTSSVTNKGLNVLKLDLIDSSTEFRYNTGISELNRVLGGGLVKGSLVLLSGDPGIGKSTLLLQICNYLSKDLSVLYVSGEESAYQLKMRAKRLGIFTSSDLGFLFVCLLFFFQLFMCKVRLSILCFSLFLR